jgi:hypothetical protein
MSRDTRALWPDLLSPALLLTTPFLIFLRDHAYPLLSIEALASLLGLALVGALLGGGARWLGHPGRIMLVSALGTLLFDVQRSGKSPLDFELVACFALLVVLGALLRRRLSQLVVAMAGVAFATTLLLPVGAAEEFKPAHPSPELRDDLPPIVHIILDEQIGVEGLPEDVDPERAHADALKRFYLDRGFRLFGRAFAISTSSKLSISNLLNLNVGAPERVFATKRREHEEVTTNAYFEAMAARGYRIHVRQSDYLDYCHGGGSASIVRCETYPLETIGSIVDSPLPAGEKAKVMAAMYVRLSPLLEALRDAYRERQPGTPLPAWGTLGRVSAASVMPVFDALEHDLAAARPGELHFAHLMLPHYPYAWDRDCAIRPRTADWLANGEPGHFPFANSQESRALRYALYLEQVSCAHRRLARLLQAMDDVGILERALVIVHGDHGSRIFMAPLDARAGELITDGDFLDAFSTLFAVRFPTTIDAPHPAVYDTRMLSIAALLRALVLDGGVPEGEEWAGPPTVFLTNAAEAPPEPRAMPEFDAGRVYSKR